MGKPLKRNANLVLLSRDHHDGLLIGWKLRQGLAFDRPIPLMAQFVSQQFEEHLAPHFADEELLLFSALDSNDPMRKQAEDEHAAIRQMVAAMPAVVDRLQIEQFATALDEHIRFEERVLFPYMEQQLSGDALARIGAELTSTHDSKHPDTWTNKFWLKDS
jgi:hemerythrin-like domain-containing protein